MDGRRGILLGAFAAVVVLAPPAFAQLIPPPVADGPSMNSMDMLYGRAGRVLENITTRIDKVDLQARTLTTSEGVVLTFANNFNPENLKVGQSVALQWEEEGGKKILHGLTPIGN